MTARADSAPSSSTIDSVDPATGDDLGSYPIAGEAEVSAAVARGRTAASWWSELTFAERRQRLLRWAGVLARRIHQLAGIVHDETGKPHADAMLEVLLAMDHIRWAATNARQVLRPQRRSPGLLMANHEATVEYQPLGVVGVIGPWNYPVFTPVGSVAYALAAGNTVVFKPSEHTTGVGQWLVDAFAQVVPEQPVLQMVPGYGETGSALCRAGVDKIAFTGSVGTAKKVMATCAETLTPVLIEAGGKDALLVDSDADLDAAADAAVWGAMSNAGQTCTGVERVYVHERVYDSFVSKVVSHVRALRAGSDDAAQLGPITMPGQLHVIRRHVTDALARGARALVGGESAVGERLVQPTVLVDVPEDAPAHTDETFGPTLTIAKVKDMDEALRRANASRYGLGAAVFSRKRGRELARRLNTGMASVNSILSFAAIPALPFGGVGDSGFGRIHGPEGLREFTRAKAVARQRFRSPITLTSFARPGSVDSLIAKLAALRYGTK